MQSMAKGDSISVVTRDGHMFALEATQNGRRVEFTTEKDAGITWAVAKEVTRGGTVVREVQAQVTEVVSVDIRTPTAGERSA